MSHVAVRSQIEADKKPGTEKHRRKIVPTTGL